MKDRGYFIYANNSIHLDYMMDTIKRNAEEIAVVIISGIRSVFMPFFDKYSGFYRYINYIFYTSYAIILFGFYHTTPESIPLLRNTILYIAVFILILRFNQLSWNNPKFAILGGNKFSEFDRKLIFSLCTFILFTHIVSDAVGEYAKDKIHQAITQPVSKTVIQPIYQYIDTSGAVDKIPALKNIVQKKSIDSAAEAGTRMPILPTPGVPTVNSSPLESFSSTFSMFDSGDVAPT